MKSKVFGPEFLLVLAQSWAKTEGKQLNVERLAESLCATFGRINWTRSSVSVSQASVTFRSSGNYSEKVAIKDKHGGRIPLGGAYAYVAYANLCWQCELLGMPAPVISEAAVEYLSRFVTEPNKS